MKELKVLVLTLYSGENEISRCKDSVRTQSFGNVTQLVISDMPNKEAHDYLYSEIMSRSNEYDIFIKLDADMVLESPVFVKNVTSKFLADDSLDMLSFTVFDFFTNSRIWGVNCFSNRCRWDSKSEGIFVDHHPKFLGRRERIIDQDNMVSHCSDPSDYQAFMFGFHRAMKIKQKDRPTPLLGHSWAHIKTVYKLKRCYISTRKGSVGQALIGTYLGLTEKEDKISNKADFRALFDGPNLKVDDVLKKLNFRNFALSMGVFRLIKAFPLYLYRKL